MPDLSDDDDMNRFYNTGGITVANHRDAISAIEGIDQILMDHFDLEIVLYGNDPDMVIGIVPYAESMQTIFRVEMTFEDDAGIEDDYEVTVEAPDAIAAINIATKVEHAGKMTSVNASAFDVPTSKVPQYVRG